MGQEHNNLPTSAAFFAWVSKDSLRVLGIDHRSIEEAHRDATERHTDTRGYPVQVILHGFPPGANPMLALVKALHETFPPSLAEGAGEPDKVQVEEADPKAGKLKKVK